MMPWALAWRGHVIVGVEDLQQSSLQIAAASSHQHQHHVSMLSAAKAVAR